MPDAKPSPTGFPITYDLRISLNISRQNSLK